MRLGSLIEFLKGVDPVIVCRFGFNNPHSYRGHYEDLAFEPAENVTVGEMLAAAESALGETFTGYKGGDYTMGEHTDCWLANYGSGGGEGIGQVLLQYMTSDAESSLAAMRQRAEEAEASAIEEEKACEEAMKERDELDDILGNLAACFDQEFSSSYGPESIGHDIRELQDNRDLWQGKAEGWEKRAREVISRAERAEACLRDAASKLSQVKEYLEDYFEGDRDHRYLGIQCIIEIGVKRITNMLADAVPSSPPTDASKMGGERERRLVEALRHVCKHLCQWNDACETGCIVSAALAEMEQSHDHP